MPDPRRVIAHLEPTEVYRRQLVATYREENRRRMQPFNDAMIRAYQPAIRAAFGSQMPFDLARQQNASVLLRTGLDA